MAVYDPKRRGSTLQTSGKVKPVVPAQSNLSRTLPRQMSSGSTRGTQTVGYGNTKIDGSNNRITVGDSIILDGDADVISIETDSNASITLGAIDTGGVTTGFGLAVTNTDGSQVGLGSIPGFEGEFGFYSTNSDGDLIMKIVNGTMYTYDIDNDTNIMQSGELPDGSYGMVVAKEGINVEDVFS